MLEHMHSRVYYAYVLTERKNVFHLNEFSVKSENYKKFKNEQKFKLS